MNKKLAILQVNTLDVGGGAEQIADNLLRAYQASGHDAWVVVGEKRSANLAVFEIPTIADKGLWASLCLKLRQWLEPMHARVRGIPRLRKNLLDLSIGSDVIARWIGMEEFHYPGSKTVLELAPKSVDVLHLHNLHGHYFDLRALTDLSQKVPVVITMHDAWLLSGNCAHSFSCDKWQTGCGLCPDISIYPGLTRDTTALNWRRKKRIYAHSQIYLAAPSQWLMNKAMASILAPAIVQSKVIPNGVDLAVFKPADREKARHLLGIDADDKVILFAANGIKRNPFKDYATIYDAIEQLSKAMTSKVIVIALGEQGESESIGNIHISYVPPISNRFQVASYYQAADVYVHASHADTFPTSILEAMACGVPVVATAVGGIPEQVDDEITGILVAPGDSQAMANGIDCILKSPELGAQMSQAAATKAKTHYSIELQAERYIAWFEEILGAHSK